MYNVLENGAPGCGKLPVCVLVLMTVTFCPQSASCWQNVTVYPMLDNTQVYVATN